MRRAFFTLTCAAALVACDDNSTPNTPTDVTDTSVQPDTTVPDTTVPDTNTPDTDTTTPTDTDTTDTTTPDTVTPTRKCTDVELETFNTCADACAPGANQQACLTTCQNGLSSECFAAYGLFASCVQNNNCLNEDQSLNTECVAQFCADEIQAVFGTPEPDDCNPVTNTGCEAGENCSVGDAEDNLYCLPAGDIAPFGDCSDDPSACSRGLCLGTETEATCMLFCDQNSDCPDNRPCNIGLQGSDFTFCGDIPVSCNVLTQDCPGGEACYIISQAGDTDCSPSNGKATGATCGFLNDCAAGNLCLGSGASGTCTKVCDTAANPSTCPQGQTCQGLGIAGSTLGACAAAGN